MKHVFPILLFKFLILFLSQSVFAAASEGQLKDITDVIAFYFKGNPAEGRARAIEKRDHYQMNTDNFNAPHIVVLDYLGGAKNIEPVYLSFATEEDPSLWALANLAIFVRELSEDKSPSPFELGNCIRNYQKYMALSKSNSVKKWNARAAAWEKWCNSNFVYSDSLEPLLKKKSGKKEAPTSSAASKAPAPVLSSLSDIDVKSFIKSRRKFSKRPRPDDVKFDRERMRKYILSLPDENLKKAELRRWNYINGSRKYLSKLINFNPYSGVIKLRRGSIKGTVKMANENSLMFVKANSSSMKKLEWKELALSQYIEFFKHYAQMRSRISGGDVSAEESRKFAAQDYLRLAVFCDWYNMPQSSIKYMKKAISFSPSIIKQAELFFLDR